MNAWRRSRRREPGVRARSPSSTDDIRTADDQALFRINAFDFAKKRNLPENEVIDLLLHATALGLFSMDWSLFCPQCCCVVESFRSLKSVHNHYHCPFCQVGYEAALDEYIAVTFTVSPNIRKIDFTTPTVSRLGTSSSRRRTPRTVCSLTECPWWTPRLPSWER